MDWIDINSMLSIYSDNVGEFEGMGVAVKEEESAAAAVPLEVAAPAGTVGTVPDGLMCVRMTDEQVEVLRKQISVYATICERLVGMLETMSPEARQEIAAGMMIGHVYNDLLVTSGDKTLVKTPKKHRWNATPTQQKILQSVFDQENGSPSKEKIQEVTYKLQQHGRISEKNVWHWFSNRRARFKRKQVEAKEEATPILKQKTF